MLITNFVNRENYSTRINFGNKTEIPESAMKYLRENVAPKNPQSILDLSKFDISQLEGIQNGIGIFEGLTFKRIAYFVKTATEFVLGRGCNNMCSHCYAKARPQSYKESPMQLSQANFEDFEELCNGIKELDNRMGFKVFKKSDELYNTLFHDADSSMITLTDKKGNVHDYADLSEMLHNATGRCVLFDTAGWNLQDVKTQARMEALVNKVMSTDKYNFMECLVSINPFHSIYSLALKNEKNGNTERAQQLKDIYTDRMANVLYTLLPLRRKNNPEYNSSCLSINLRAFADNVNMQGYDTNALSGLIDSIYNKVVKIHEIKNKNNVDAEDLEWLKKKLDIDRCSTFISSVGRAEDIVSDKNSSIYKTTKRTLYNNVYKGSKYCNDGILDLNGKFYVTNWHETYPTDITLNYSSKGQPTASIHPNLRKDTITGKLM